MCRNKNKYLKTDIAMLTVIIATLRVIATLGLGALVRRMTKAKSLKY